MADVVPRRLATYTIPRIDVLVSAVYQDKPNVGTDQIGSLVANYTLTPADQAAAAAQIGRPLTIAGALTVNLLAPGEMYGPRIRQLDFAAKKIIRFGSQRLTRRRGLLQPAEQQRDAGVQPDVRAERGGVAVADVVHEPARLPSERRVRLVG